MDDLIRKSALIKRIRDYADEVGCVRGEYELANGILKAISVVEDAPTVDVVPVVHAEWIKKSMGMRKDINTGKYIEKFSCDCPICGYHTGNQGARFNFCPNCGADMRKKVQE